MKQKKPLPLLALPSKTSRELGGGRKLSPFFRLMENNHMNTIGHNRDWQEEANADIKRASQIAADRDKLDHRYWLRLGIALNKLRKVHPDDDKAFGELADRVLCQLGTVPDRHERSAAMWAAKDLTRFSKTRKAHPRVRSVRGVYAKWSEAQKPQPTPAPTPQPAPKPAPQPAPTPRPAPQPAPTPQPAPQPTPTPQPVIVEDAMDDKPLTDIQRIAGEKYLDGELKTYKEVEDYIGESNIVARRIVSRIRGYREGLAVQAVRQLDPSMFGKSGKAKYEARVKQLEKDFEFQVKVRVAEEVEKWKEETGYAKLEAQLKATERALTNSRGLIGKAQWKILVKALHPDMGATTETKAEAMSILNEIKDSFVDLTKDEREQRRSKFAEEFRKAASMRR